MSPATIIESLEESVGLNGSPRNLRLAIETVLAVYHGVPSLQAAEQAEKFVGRVALGIADREASISATGGAPILRLVGSTNEIVVGFCYAMAGESSELTVLRKRRSHASSILERLRHLTFQEFERFGARFLKEIGARVGKVTPHSNDQGIDFFGEFSLGQLHDAPGAFLMLANDVRLLFAGQAKHYPDRKIKPDTIRELIGAMTLARTKTHSTDGVDIFGDLNVRPFSPVLALIFTTGYFTGGALRLAEAAGVIAKTGHQLAVFLADRGVGLIHDGDVAKFDEDAFSSWLNDIDAVQVV